MDIDWDIISGFDEVASLVKFLNKYHSQIDFYYKHNEHSISTFEYAYKNIKKKEKEYNISEEPLYEEGYSSLKGNEVILKIIDSDPQLFQDNFKIILDYDKKLFFQIYDKYKEKLNISIAYDNKFSLEEFIQADNYGLIKDYYEFIFADSNNSIFEKLLSEKKIDLYHPSNKEKYSTFGEEYINDILMNTYISFSDNFYDENKTSDLELAHYNLLKFQILMKHIDSNKNIFPSPDSFLDLIKNTVDFKFTLNEFDNLTHIFTEQNDIKNFDVNKLFSNDFLENFNLKNFNNNQKHFNLLFAILEKQNNLNYIIENKNKLYEIYKNHYPEIIWTAIKRNDLFSYSNLIREPLISVIEKQYLFRDTAYKYINCFSENIKNDKELISEIKKRFSLDDHYQDNGFMTSSDYKRLTLVFENDNFMNIIKFKHENSKKFDFMLDFIKGSNSEDFSLIENNSPKFHKTHFVNKSGYINKYPVLKATMESLIIKESLSVNDEIEQKPVKRL